MKTNIKVLLSVLTFLCILSTANAQQAQLTEIVKGVRLPQLTKSNKYEITNVNKDNTSGQSVYNIENNCLEYWNGGKWISLCFGKSIKLKDSCEKYSYIYATPPMFDIMGKPVDNCHSSFTPEDDFPCSDDSNHFSVYLIEGTDYANLKITNEETSTFSLTFNENKNTTARVAVVRVLNACSKEYQDFLFTQRERVCSDDPLILTASDTVICLKSGAGSVTLTPGNTCPIKNDLYWYKDGVRASQYGNNANYYVSGSSATGEWYVMQGSRISNKITITGKQPTEVMGMFEFYDYIKIDGKKPSDDHGLICLHEGLELKIDSAANLPDNTYFRWQFQNGNESVTVTVAYTTDRIFKWYPSNNDPDYESMSRITVYPIIPWAACYNDMGTYSFDQITFRYSPPTPVINGGDSGISDCNGIPITLNATKPDGSAYPSPTQWSYPYYNELYEWFLNGNKISRNISKANLGDLTAQANFTADAEGSYTVRFKGQSLVNDGYNTYIMHCPSQISEPFNIKRNTPITLNWLNQADDSVYSSGDNKIYSVIANPYPDSCVWTSSDPNIARVLPSADGQSAAVYFYAFQGMSAFVDIQCKAYNTCGEAVLTKRVKILGLE